MLFQHRYDVVSTLKRRHVFTGLMSNATLMDLDQQNVWEKPFWKKDTLKAQSCKLKKHWQMIAYVFQKYPENFAFQLYIILQ